MIVVIQTVPSVLETLQALVSPEHAEKIFFTDDHRKVLDRVLAEKDKPGRTVVVSSSVFNVTALMSGDILATGVKGVDQTAWFFIYSTMPRVNKHVDGVIDKMDGESMYDHVVEFLGMNFDEIESIEELRRRLPWLK